MRDRIKWVFIFLFLLFSFSSHAQTGITVLSWNLENFGKAKSDSAIHFIANTIKDFDIVAIQEVVAGNGGAEAVARLADVLNRKGFKWDYRISDPTSSENSHKRERYAFLWKPSKASLIGRPWLEKQYSTEIDREPFLATFKTNGKLFTLVNFHAITKKMQPETEIKYFKFFPAQYPGLNLIFSGDFNCPQSHSVFNPLKKMGFKPALSGQLTSLKTKCINGNCLASEFDNIFYHSGKINFVQSGAIHFYHDFLTLKEARIISDHIPVWFHFSIK